MASGADGHRGRFGIAVVAGALALLPVEAALGSEACGGPVVVAGHDADDHGFADIYADVYGPMMAHVRNGGHGILALGVEELSQAGRWIDDVAAHLVPPQPVTFVSGAAVGLASFDGFAVLHVPSLVDHVEGGIDASENALLAGRRDDVAAFVNAGGGLFGLMQGEDPHAWEYLSAVVDVETIHVPPSGRLPSFDSFDDVSTTIVGRQLGITDTNLDGCCFHEAFTAYPAFLNVLAFSNTPFDSDFDDLPVFLGGVRRCLLPHCGDGDADPHEECDDGNLDAGDCCSATCSVETLPGCGPPVACAPCTLCASAAACHADHPCDSLVVMTDGTPRDVTCDPPGPWPVGTITVEVTADGWKGHLVELECEVVVVDCEPPSCKAPDPIVLECGDPASALVLATFLESAVPGDACPGSRVVDVVVPPDLATGCGAGPARVAWVVRDGTGAERVCTSTVTVIDTISPVLTVPPPLVVECAAPGQVRSDDPRIAAWLASAAAMDACTEAIVTHDAPPAFPVGCAPGLTTVVTFRAVDDHGNESSATSTVTAVDTTPPAFVVAPFGCGGCTMLWPPSHAYVDVTVAETGVTAIDACAGGEVSVTFASCRSSQPEDARGEGDGATLRDCVVQPELLSLRAERSASCPGGRSYATTVRAVDPCGNVVESAPAVLCVGHDHREPPQGARVFRPQERGGRMARDGENGAYGEEPCGAGCPACGG